MWASISALLYICQPPFGFAEGIEINSCSASAAILDFRKNSTLQARSGSHSLVRTNMLHSGAEVILGESDWHPQERRAWTTWQSWNCDRNQPDHTLTRIVWLGLWLTVMASLPSPLDLFVSSSWFGHGEYISFHVILFLIAKLVYWGQTPKPKFSMLPQRPRLLPWKLQLQLENTEVDASVPVPGRCRWELEGAQ